MNQAPDSTTILARLRAKSPPRVALVVLCLLGFLFQSHVAQTHVHQCADGLAAAAQAVPCTPASGGDEPRQPGGGDNPSSCALCQVAAHGGAAPLPAVALSVEAPRITLLAPVQQAPVGAVAAVSHSWQSRGPPTV